MKNQQVQLAKNEISPSRVLEQAIELHHLGKLKEAELRYRAILEGQSNHADAKHLLGVVLSQQGRNAEAFRLIRAALKIKPSSAAAWSNFGLVLGKLGRIEEALACHDKAIAINPAYAEAFNNRGDALRLLNRPQGALESFDKAIAIKPDYAEAFNNRGNALTVLERQSEALASYDTAIAFRPNYAEAFNNRGVALLSLKRPGDALASFDKAIAFRPNYAEAFNNSGNALFDLKRFADAIASFDTAIAIRPEYPAALNGRGHTLRLLKRPEEALTNFDEAIAIQPNFAEAFNNRSIALLDLKRPEEALASCDKAIAIKPEYAEAFSNRGNALTALNRQAEALASYDRAIRIKADYAGALFNRGLTALLIGDFASGWSGYERRFDREDARKPTRSTSYPRWDGEDVKGKRIIAYEEQGIGDIIQFSRYLVLLSARGARVTFLVRSTLHRIFKSLAPTVRIVAELPAHESFDLECALLSLPFAFRTTLDTIPSATSYLAPEAPLVAMWRKRIGGHGLKVGIAWQGKPDSQIDSGRSILLRCFEPIAKVPGVRLFSLQKHHGVDQVSESEWPIETFGDEFDSGPDAFIDTAAIMAGLDLIVTSDTSIAHLAGALGRPVWVALKQVPDWRWMLDRADSPWYPRMTLYRQRAREDWNRVFSQIAADLVKLNSESKEN